MAAGEQAGEIAAVGPIADLTRQLERIADPAARGAALDLVRAVLAWHADALRELTAAIAAEPGGGARLGRLAQLPRIAALLLLHGLHPEDFPTRVRRGLATIAPLAAARGGELELLDVLGERVRLRWRGPRAAPARGAIQLAVWSAAPEATEIVIEGVEEPASFVPLEVLAPRAG